MLTHNAYVARSGKKRTRLAVLKSVSVACRGAESAWYLLILAHLCILKRVGSLVWPENTGFPGLLSMAPVRMALFSTQQPPVHGIMRRVYAVCIWCG